MFDLSTDLMKYTDTLRYDLEVVLRLLAGMITASPGLSRTYKQKRFPFFKTVPRQALPLNKYRHRVTSTETMNCLILCPCPRGDNSPSQKSLYRCSSCTVPQCRAIHAAYPYHCWTIWNINDHVIPRNFPKTFYSAPMCTDRQLKQHLLPHQTTRQKTALRKTR